MSEFIESLHDLVSSPAYVELEEIFREEAKKIRVSKIDRNLPYDHQGLQSHVNELTHDAILKTLQIIRAKVEAKANPKSWK